jgi:hypothetical protein
VTEIGDPVEQHLSLRIALPRFSGDVIRGGVGALGPAEVRVDDQRAFVRDSHIDRDRSLIYDGASIPTDEAVA